MYPFPHMNFVNTYSSYAIIVCSSAACIFFADYLLIYLTKGCDAKTSGIVGEQKWSWASQRVLSESEGRNIDVPMDVMHMCLTADFLQSQVKKSF